MEKDIGYKFLKSINLCFIYIQFFFFLFINQKYPPSYFQAESSNVPAKMFHSMESR